MSRHEGAGKGVGVHLDVISNVGCVKTMWNGYAGRMYGGREINTIPAGCVGIRLWAFEDIAVNNRVFAATAHFSLMSSNESLC